jgi:hypothetical protein
MLDSSFLLDTAAGCASFVARCVDAAAPPPLAPCTTVGWLAGESSLHCSSWLFAYACEPPAA